MFGLVCENEDSNASCGDASASCDPNASCVRRACACNEGYITVMINNVAQSDGLPRGLPFKNATELAKYIPTRWCSRWCKCVLMNTCIPLHIGPLEPLEGGIKIGRT
jgi:hypothetical protein